MKAIALAFIATFLTVTVVAAQLNPDIKALISSEDPVKRAAGAHELADEDPQGPEARAALISLLAKENGIVKAAFVAGPGASTLYGEGYSEYVAWLTGTVMKIADVDPNRPDVWDALLAIYPGPGDSGYGRWLGTHGDKALPYLLTYAADHRADSWDRNNRTDALNSLAQIVAYERMPETIHRLSAKDLRTVETLVRAGINDDDLNIRLATVSAMAIMGSPDDLAALDNIALTDPMVITNGGQSGTETRFPLREYARDVAARMRARIAERSGR